MSRVDADSGVQKQTYLPCEELKVVKEIVNKIKTMYF